MFDIFGIAELAELVIRYLVYLAILIFFLNAKNNGERLKIILVVSGVFFVVWMSQGIFDFSPESAWSFTLVQMVIMVWLAFAGIPLMIDRRLAVLLFLIFIFSLSTNLFFSFALGMISYIIVSFGFIADALNILSGKMNAKNEAQNSEEKK